MLESGPAARIRLAGQKELPESLQTPERIKALQQLEHRLGPKFQCPMTVPVIARNVHR